jgi:hypothetical protein
LLWAEVAICSEEIFAEAEELSQQVAKIRQRFVVIDGKSGHASYSPDCASLNIDLRYIGMVAAILSRI